jgi:hypothetical protein
MVLHPDPVLYLVLHMVPEPDADPALDTDLATDADPAPDLGSGGLKRTKLRILNT